jgi:hypothetical protein
MATNVDTTSTSTKPRKYSPEQLQAEIARPRKKAGRPRKYATEEERKRAMADSVMRTYWRKKNAKRNVENPPEVAMRNVVGTTADESLERHRAVCLRYYYSHRDAYLLSRTAALASKRGTLSCS